MGHHDQDPGHGEPGHVHDENWNRHMMETDDARTDVERTTRTEVDRSGTGVRVEEESQESETVVRDR